MTNYKPLFVVLIITLVVGVILNLTVGSFYNINQMNPDSFLSGDIDAFLTDLFIEPTLVDGIGNIPLTLNPFAVLPDTATEFIYNQIIILSWIPSQVLIPFMIIFTLSFIWSIVKLILP